MTWTASCPGSAMQLISTPSSHKEGTQPALSQEFRTGQGRQTAEVRFEDSHSSHRLLTLSPSPEHCTLRRRLNR